MKGTETNNADLLSRFCAKNDLYCREYLEAPFRTKHGIVAANGHVLVCIPDDWRECANEAPLDVVARINSWLDEPVVGTVVRADTIRLPAPLACLECDGLGKVPVAQVIECEECGGTGEVTCDMNHDHECEKCDGDGKYESGIKAGEFDECETCLGLGHRRDQHVKVAHLWLNRRYVELIASLPNCVLTLGDSHFDQAQFNFDGGRGIVMPMRAPSPAQAEEATA